MLEDFIKANNLQAQILQYPAKGKLAKCRLFRCNGTDVLAVCFEKDKISEEKLKKAAGSKTVEEVEAAEAEDITGYKAEFLPPISVYGVKVLIDKRVMQAKKVRCLVAEEKTLEITPKEITESNEEAEEAELTA